MNNIHKIQAVIREEKAAGALISTLPGIRWACGFSGSNALLLVTRDGGAHLFTDGRYATQSEMEVQHATVHIASGPLAVCLHETGHMPTEGPIIVESDHLTLARHAEFTGLFPACEWLPRKQLLARTMAVKSAAEIDNIRNAQAITDDVFEGLLASIKPGITESEIAAEITYQHLVRGASKMSFDPIVASGPNGALPHARPSDRKLQHGDLVVLDFGCFYNGYASDMTRTLAIGEPPASSRKVYEVVRAAQQKALDAASSNMTTKNLDAVARDVIEQAGYGQYFTHSLGHGVGLDIHEWPRVSWQVEDMLAENMVITIEPGIYIPDDVGVRIEDMVVLRSSGCEVLGRTTKELVVL